MARGGESKLLRRAPWSPVTLTPIALPDGLLKLRSPRLSDGAAWSAARLANRQWLERAFPAWGDDWEAEQSEVAWAQRWARLRRLAVVGRASPFVMTLDGALVGEIGIDAIDVVTGAGEASVWIVREHGSPAVVQAAMLLFIEHAFTSARPLSRMLSPVATSSRRGRTPGLTSVGFAIEGTVPRRVGGKGLVDHDIWVLHNTDAVRRTTTDALRPLRDATATPSTTATPPLQPARGVLAQTAGRAAVREARGLGRRAVAQVDRRRTGHHTAVRNLPPTDAGTTVTLRPVTRHDPDLAGPTMPRHSTRWAVEAHGRVQAVLGHHDDVGTATTEVHVATRPGADRDVLLAATRALLDDLRPAAGEQRLLVVRVPAGAPRSTTLDDELLTVLGLEHLATFRGHPGTTGDTTQDTTHEWGGEDVWRMPSTS